MNATVTTEHNHGGKLSEKGKEKYFVLDTNVLIHNPLSIFSFADNNVVLPITVIEELDNFKSIHDKKGMHSRQVLREIDKLVKKGALSKGAKMQNGGKLFILFQRDEKHDTEFGEHKNDNRIIGVARDIQTRGDMVFFVSKDVNARIKAEALGIPARDYEKEKVEYTSLYTGWRTLPVDDAEISQIYKNNKYHPTGVTFRNNEYCLVQAKTNVKSTAICKFDSITNNLVPINTELSALDVHPINMEQRFAFDMLMNPEIKLVTLIGQAGTGKTLIAIACALQQTIEKNPIYERVLVARPIIPMGKDIGFLPGSKDAKLGFWMQPIFDNLEFILKTNKTGGAHHGETSTSIDYLLKSQKIEIEALTYIRGRSIPNQFMIVDEAQNLTPHEIKTIISRAGEGTKIVLTGDPEQIDNPYLDANSNGLTYLVEQLKGEKLYGHIYLSKSERSALAGLAVEKL